VRIRASRRTGRIPELFQRRLVITLPRWSPLVIAGGVAFGLVDAFTVMTSIVCAISTVVALIAVVRAQKIVWRLRAQVHSVLNDIDNEDMPVTSIYSDDTPPQRVRFTNVNGSKTGVSGQG